MRLLLFITRRFMLTKLANRLLRAPALFTGMVGFVPALSEASTISGTIYDGINAIEVAEVGIFVVGTEWSTQSTEEGVFLIEGLPDGNYTVSFSKPGFQRLTLTEVKVPSEAAASLQILLVPDLGEASELDEVTMTLAQLQSGTALLLANRQTSAAMTDMLGADMFSRLGVGDAASALSKLAGATVVDGGFVYIRGLGDRYGNTQLNAITLPSPDPDRNSVPLDMFPTGAIEAIETLKTFTPDRRGDFTGGSVNIVTLSFPEERFLDVSIGTNYNTNATGNKNFLTFPGGSYDWLGYGDSAYNMPLPAIPVRQQGLTPQQAAQAFTPYMFPTTKTPGPDVGISVAYGDQFMFEKTAVGVVFALDYDLEYQFYDDGQTQRGAFIPNRGFTLTDSFRDTRGNEIALLGGLLGVGFQFDPDNAIAANFLYNHEGDKDARLLAGRAFNDPDQDPNEELRSSVLRWVEREIWTFQLRGDHTLTSLQDLEFDWYAAYSSATQNEPDTRFYADFYDPATNTARNPTGASSTPQPQRRWRDIEENRRDVGFDFTQPFDSMYYNETAEFKFGFALDNTRREEAQYTWTYTGYRAAPNPNTNAHAPATGINLTGSGSDESFEGARTVYAGYLMMDYPILESVRLIGGARVENANTRTEFDRIGLPPERFVLNQTNVLPAGALVWALNDSMNIRASITQTVARPTFRELSPVETLDFFGGDNILGNPGLSNTNTNNYDLRWEWFLDDVDIVAVSAFYKDLKDPIERIIIAPGGTQTYQTWANFPSATLYGFELEWQKGLEFVTPELRNFSIGGNFAYVESEVSELSPTVLNIPGQAPLLISSQGNQPLEGQSKYVFNFNITYNNPDWGTTTSLVYNYFTRRLTQAGLQTPAASNPSIYEEGYGTLDFIISQSFGKDDAWSVTFAAKNLLNPMIRQTYDGTSDTYQSYTKGMDFGISLSYAFF